MGLIQKEQMKMPKPNKANTGRALKLKKRWPKGATSRQKAEATEDIVSRFSAFTVSTVISAWYNFQVPV